MIPKECKMPDISDLDFPLMKYLILPALIGDPGITPKEGLYRRNFVRLADKAIREYQWARNSIIAQIEEARLPDEEIQSGGRIPYLMNTLKFIDHFENCINAINRLLKQLDRIKREPESWKIPNEVRRKIESRFKAISNIRDSAEHMEEFINDEKLHYGEHPVMLSIDDTADGVRLATYNLKFSDVALLIRELHRIARDLCGEKRPSVPASVGKNPL